MRKRDEEMEALVERMERGDPFAYDKLRTLQNLPIKIWSIVPDPINGPRDDGVDRLEQNS